MVRYPMDSAGSARSVDGLLAFLNADNGITRFQKRLLVGAEFGRFPPALDQTLQECFQRREERNVPIRGFRLVARKMNKRKSLILRNLALVRLIMPESNLQKLLSFSFAPIFTDFLARV